MLHYVEFVALFGEIVCLWVACWGVCDVIREEQAINQLHLAMGKVIVRAK